MPWVAFKALPAGYVATSVWSVKGESTKKAKAKAVASGLYTFWQDPNALAIGQQSVPSGAASFGTVQDCLTACDYDEKCIGITIQETVIKTKIGSTCQIIHGDDRPGRFKRTVVRTELSRVALPTAFLCPSGYAQSGEGSSACTPITTPQQLTFVLTAVGTCDAATIQSAKDSWLAYLSNPETSFGVFTPNLVLEVGCLDASSYQVSRLLGVVVHKNKGLGSASLPSYTTDRTTAWPHSQLAMRACLSSLHELVL